MPDVRDVDAMLIRLGGPEVARDDRERIELITALERLKGATAAAQARLTVSFDAGQRRDQAARGVPAGDQGRGIASQVALARHESPVRGCRRLGLAKALVHEMPHTLRALAEGRISEWRATLVARETAALSAEHRALVDAELAGRLDTLGDGGVAREARRIAYRLDPACAVRRRRTAEGDRRVTIRPAPDTMSLISGLLPVAQGVAVHAALKTHADSLRAHGDERTRGQIMADTFVERLTGQSTAAAVPVAVQLVMTDRTLLGDDDTPARIVGHGPVPASHARSLVRGAGAAADQAMAWVRRLYTTPESRQLVAMDSRRREFPAALRSFLVMRDEVCRTPWCDAPIRHADHVVRAADGGPTSARNGQGLCAACNQAKEAPGWSTSASRDGPAPTIRWTTPTGHSYDSPPAPFVGGLPSERPSEQPGRLRETA